MNDLNILTKGWLKPNCLSNIKSDLKNILKVIKFSYQRITKGYCASDTYNLDDYLIRLMRDSFKYFTDNLNSYPGDDTPEGRTSEDWEKYLNNIVYLLDQSLESSYINGNRDPKLYSKREEEIHNLRRSAREEAFKYILKRFDSFWD